MATFGDKAAAVITNLYQGSQKLIGVISKTGDVIEDLWSASIVQNKGYAEGETFGGKQLIDLFSNLGTNIPSILKGETLKQVKLEAELRRKINEETGLTGKLSEDVRESMLKAYPAVLNLGYGMEQLSTYFTKMVELSGKWSLQNKESLVRAAEVSRAFVGDLDKMAEIVAEMEKVGLGAVSASDAIEKAGISSTSLGLRSKKTIIDIKDNIKEINTYGFKNGIDGLARMSQLSTEFRMNMSETFKIAKKVFSPEGAIELSANLQVIGGILGDFNDPLKLMYMATNNVEGLQTALIDAAKSLATYNEEQGRFEITGINLRKAQAMAEELGIEYKDLANGAIAAAERMQASSELMATGLQMSDDDREFLTNLSQMEGGEMVIKVPETLAEKFEGKTTLALHEMTEPMLKELQRNRESFQKQDAMSIAMNQLTLVEQIERNVVAIAAATKIQLSRMFKDQYEGSNIEEKLQLIAANTGFRVEDLRAAGKDMEPLKFVTWLDNFRKTFLSGDADAIKNKNKEVLDKINAQKDKETAERIAAREVRHVHEYNASPTLLDNLGRFIARSPQTWEDIYDAYDHNERTFTYYGD